MLDGFAKLDVRTSETTIHLAIGGSGPPLLLLHGYPQTHVIWHRVAPELAKDFTVVCTDLRGYGDSGKPASDDTHAAYSKRTMARDQAEVMMQLGFDRYGVAGHDRGGRVAHRLALDYPENVTRLAVLDIAPTLTMYRKTAEEFARAYYHWFFLIQPAPLPERLISYDPEFYLRKKLGSGSAGMSPFAPEALAEYLRCFHNPETVAASCEDYRASASIDLQHDEADITRKVECPLLALWGNSGAVARCFDVLAEWRARAADVRGGALPGGHYLAEELPELVTAELHDFFSGRRSVIFDRFKHRLAQQSLNSAHTHNSQSSRGNQGLRSEGAPMRTAGGHD